MKEALDPLVTTGETIDMMLDNAMSSTEKVIRPYQRTAFRRFPVLFTLLTTFGVASVFFGFERFIMEIEWLNDRPLLILGMGLLVLALTGTLYKRL